MLALQHRILLLIGIKLTHGLIAFHLFNRGVGTTDRPDFAFLFQ